jgi:hypothetical protein
LGKVRRMAEKRPIRWGLVAILVGATIAVAAPASSAPCPAGQYEISGTVVSDLDGRPLTEVTSVGIRALDGPYEDGEATVLPASTYATCVPPGSYEISFFADSFMFEWYDDAFDRASATPVVVTDADVPGVDASLGWATITGRVTSKRTGAPLTGGAAAVDAATGDGFDQVAMNEDGVYTLSVPPGRWVVGWNVDYYWYEWYADAKRFSKAEVIEVTPFTPLIAGIDAELKPCRREVCEPRGFAP